MGSAQSANISKVITQAVSNVSSKIIQNQTTASANSIIISIEDTDGDVNIENNTFNQKATINMSALLKALVTQTAQQNLTTELSQTAKSLVSGLNIFQFSDAENELDSFMSASVDVVTNISQTCFASQTNDIGIYVQNTKGTVNIKNNVSNQISSVISSCVEDAVSNNSTLQSLSQKISQAAAATSEGLNLNWIIFIIFCIIVAVGLVGYGIENMLTKFLFIAMFMIGIYFIISYYLYTNSYISTIGFSTLIENNPNCGATSYGKNLNYPTAGLASEACRKDKTCLAYDWKGMSINQNNSYQNISPPQTTFYSYLAQNPCNDVTSKQDTVKITKIPTFNKGKGDVNSQNITATKGDMYLDTLTTKYYQFKGDFWDEFNNSPFVKNFNTANTVDWGSSIPTQASQSGNVYIYYNSADPAVFTVYVSNGNGWSTTTSPGPGLIPNVPSNFNASGFKTVTKITWKLWLGITLSVIGAIGTAYVFLVHPETSKKPTDKPTDIKPSDTKSASVPK